ncbi:MAG: hypothetical protein E7453_05210 [Ruminococcaceae bacterium]|nr:hypothetical protein [Oscillospiraceae bacterium]
MAIFKRKTEYLQSIDEDTPEYQQYLKAQAVSRNKRILKYILILICCALAVGLMFYTYAIYSDNWLQTGYINNVSIGRVSLQGLSVEEAIALLQQHERELLPKNDLIVKIADQILVLTYQDTKATLDVSAIANTAYLHGRNNGRDGNDLYVLDPLDFVNVDAGTVRALLKAFVQPFNGRPQQTTAELIGERPDLTQEPTPGEANQILVVTLGTSKYLSDPETIFQTLKTAHRTRSFVIEGETKLVQPDPPSAALLFHEYCISAVNASIDPETSIVTESSVGYGFQIGEVQKLLDEAEEGETITIPLMRLQPSITTDMLIGTRP